MNRLRTTIFKTALDALNTAGVFWLMSPFTRGRGIIFTLHHVRPASDDPFQPNRILEITPEFLERCVRLVRAKGYDIIPIDEISDRLAQRKGRRFAVFTFDDGYRDNLEFAYPVMKRLDAPFTIYVTTGLPDGSAELWWRALEEVVRSATGIALETAEGRLYLPAGTLEEKYDTYEKIYWRLRTLPEAEKLAQMRELATRYGHDLEAYTRAVSLTWDEVRQLAEDPLVTVGAHTVSHPALAKIDRAQAEREMAHGRDILRDCGVPMPAHFSYPYGSPNEAAIREFDLCRKLGFTTGVTTRPGVVFSDHADHLAALPRVSLNGEYQAGRFVRMFLSGAPFALFNRFRRLSVA